MRWSPSAATRQKINPLVPVDLVIDHSVIVDEFGTPKALADNVALEYSRNGERYTFLKWGQSAFDNFSVVPPGTGICHQVNLEYLSQTVWTKSEDGTELAYPDSLVGTDSHTTMVNGLAVLGWGVGGIEAEAAMLGQPLSMLIPEVIGFKLNGQAARRHDGDRPGADRHPDAAQEGRGRQVRRVLRTRPRRHERWPTSATISNMAPEYGATCGFFPIDQKTIDFLTVTGRDEDRIALVEAYAKAQGMWRDAETPDPVFTDTLELDMGDVAPSLAGPKRPQDRVLLDCAKPRLWPVHEDRVQEGFSDIAKRYVRWRAQNYDIGHGDVVIAAITSCTNTSNPSVMIAAGLVARKAVAKGLTLEALGQDLAGARLPGRGRLPRERRPAGGPGRPGLQPGRLRLHHLHRQLGPAARRRSPRRSTTTTSWSPPCSRATATSRAA